MRKDYSPPIASRSDQELYDILSDYQNWEKGAIVQAKIELEKRTEFSSDVSEKVQSIHKELNRVKKNKALKKKKLALETYSSSDIILYILVYFPLKIIAFLIFESFEDPEDSQKIKKKQQKIWMIIASFLFWGGIIALLISFS